MRIDGLVDNPVDLDLAQLRALPHHEQITQHFCIQGWSGIAKWGGVSMQTVVDLVEPHAEAKWVIFYSLGEGADKGVYYDAHPIEHMTHHLTMLAYDMNDEPLPFGHGAPLRLRNEIELGFKQVKWIKGIEFVAEYSGASRTRTGDLLGAIQAARDARSRLFSALQSQRIGHQRAPREAPIPVDYLRLGWIWALVPIPLRAGWTVRSGAPGEEPRARARGR